MNKKFGPKALSRNPHKTLINAGVTKNRALVVRTSMTPSGLLGNNYCHLGPRAYPRPFEDSEYRLLH